VRINPRAPIKPVNFGNADIADILDIRGFNLNAILEIDPDFLTSDEHEHDEMGSDAGAAWKPGEKRASKMVFIGRDMPKDVLLDGLAQCVATQG
jgi:G3E family GTPase